LQEGVLSQPFQVFIAVYWIFTTHFFRGLNFVDRCKKYLLSQLIVQRLQQLVTLATTDVALRVVLLVLQYEVNIATIFLMVATTS